MVVGDVSQSSTASSVGVFEVVSNIKDGLKAKTASILKNDRAALKSCQSCHKQPQNTNNRYFDNVISITPFLKRDAGCGGDVA